MGSGKPEWKVIPESVETCRDEPWVQVAPGHSMPRWAVTRFVDPTGAHPTIEARAEVRGGQVEVRPTAEVEESFPDAALVVTQVTVGDGTRSVTAADLRALAPHMYTLAIDVLIGHTQPITEPGYTGSVDNLVRAMRKAARGQSDSRTSREDHALRRWEEEFQPDGLGQREAATKLGLTYSTFRSYLTHARKRRDASR